MIIYNGGPTVSRKEVVLFPFDDYSVPFQRGVRLQLVSYYSAAEHGTRIVVPLGPAGAPDSRWISYYGAVNRVGDELWMWYLGQGAEEHRHQQICFARSKDGYHWEKPNLGLVEYNGNTRNNLVALAGDHYQVSALVVLYDPDDPDPKRRFKMVFETNPHGPAQFNVAFSEDGLSWTGPSGPFSGPSCEMSGGTKFNGCYHICVHGGGHFGPRRKLQTYVSYDFEHWTEASCMGFLRGNIPPRPMIYDVHAGEQVHLGASLWNRGNVIIGFYGQWHGHPTNDRRLVSIDIGLVVSNDALHYREPIPDFRIIAASEDGMWPFEKVRPFNYPALEQGQGFENVGDETLIWYAPWPEECGNGIRVANWPRDRLGYFEPFMAVKMASLQEAHFVSAPIDLQGKPARIYMNVDGISEYSKVNCEILDERFFRIPGYTRETCLAPKENGLRQPVKWERREIVENVEGPIRIRVNFGGIRAEDAKLYAVYVEESG